MANHAKISENASGMISKKTDLMLNVPLFLYVLACILPFLLVVSVSFTDEKLIIVDGYRFIPQQFSLNAYRYLMLDFSQIAKAYGVSIFVTIVGTTMSLLLTALFAYPISRTDLPYRNFFAFFIFFTMLFNGGLVPWYLVYTKMLHLQNSIWALIIPLLVQPFFVLIMRTFFATTIPSALLESAKIDGAGELRIFFKIVLPLSLPVMATIGLFNTLNYWNDWFLSLVFIHDGKTISLQYLMFKTMLNVQYLSANDQAQQALDAAGNAMELPSETIRMAMAVIGIGPIVLAYPFFQRYFVKGLTIGAVKG
jgi:putative aldouronate transport system permease protein